MRKNILILEDEHNIQNMIQSAILGLSELNARILNTSSSNEALHLADIYDIDIFIIDIKLPDGNGIEFAEKIRKNYSMAPIIFETSVEDVETELDAYRSTKCIYYIHKPFSIKEIGTIIKDAIRYADNLKKEYSVIKINKSSSELRYKIKNILYIEVICGTLCIVSYHEDEKKVRKEYITRYSLKELLENLENKKDLIQCHRNYVINPKRIVAIYYNKECIELEHVEKVIPLGGKFKKNLY